MNRIVLSATASVAANNILGVSDPSTLRHPDAKPMAIDEIRISCQGPAVGVMRLKLALGSIPITKDYVPIELFGKLMNQSSGAPGQNGNAGTGWDFYTWRLKRPIYIPKGNYLEPTFQNSALGFSATLATRITYVGRVVDSIPAQRFLPYVASWVSPSRAGGSDYTDQTTETDLYNPHTVPLHVERLMGIIQNTYSTMTQNAFEVQYGVSPVAGQQLITVQMIDAAGEPCIRDPVPFSHLFDQATWSWPVSAVLPPKGYYLFFLEELLSGGSLTSSETFAPMISMVGYREALRGEGA